MAYLLRVLIALAGGLAALAMLLVFLAFLLSDEPMVRENRRATDAWLGRWNGPEGTFLRLEGSGGRYTVTIHDLDGPRSFDGQVDGRGVRFVRDGVEETLRHTNGAATGMKWLSDKSDCLTVRAGEGYCRD